MSKKQYSTTIVCDEWGNDGWGVIIQDFKTEKEAEVYIKRLREGEK